MKNTENSERIVDTTGAAVIRGIIKSISSKIPIYDIGINIYDELVSQQVQRKISRLEELFKDLEERFVRNELSLNNDYISKIDFLDIFEQTIKYVVNERIKEKRKAFLNILISSIFSKECSYDKTENYFRILEQMNIVEMMVLKVLIAPRQFNETNGLKIKTLNERKPGIVNIVTVRKQVKSSEILSELMELEIEYIYDALNFLAMNRLVESYSSSRTLKTSGNPINVLNDLLTGKGKDFVSFIFCQ